MNKSITMLMVLFLFAQFPIEKTKAADFYSYLPFIYKVPEGSVGIFKNGQQFYDNVYPAGVYATWPFDEGFNISIVPEKAVVTEISCITVEGVKIMFPEITVHYQIQEESALELIKNHGVDFLQPLIKNPVKQGVSDLCSTMTAEAVYLEKFSILKQYITDYLVREQGDKDSGLTIGDLEINRPRVPDEMLENYVGRNVSPGLCEPPYEIFYTLEDERAARERLCGTGGQPGEPQQKPNPEADMARIVEPGLITVDKPAALPTFTMDSNPEYPLQPKREQPSEVLVDQPVFDPFIDDEDSNNVEAEPAELTQYMVQDNLARTGENAEAVNSPGDVVAWQHQTQALEQGDELLPQPSFQDQRKDKKQSAKGLWQNLWQNNNSQLYLTW